MNQQLETIYLCPNGVVAAFDTMGEQIPEFQRTGWMNLYFDYLESRGVDPTKLIIKAQLNGGVWKQVVPIKLPDGWNASFK